MLRLVAFILGFALLLTGPAALRGEIVRDLYAAQIPVANQTASALNAAAGKALAEVLVKVSGSVDVLENPVIAAQLAQARRHVQQYAYGRDNGAEGALFARFEFEDTYVTRLITEAGVPLWTANRPVVLVWLVIEDFSGRQFVNWDSAPALAEELVTEFSRRGIPVQLPLYDLADSSMISPDAAWRLNAPFLRTASSRYNVRNILAGRLATLSSGSIVGDWVYLYEEDRIDRSVSARDALGFDSHWNFRQDLARNRIEDTGFIRILVRQVDMAIGMHRKGLRIGAAGNVLNDL